jgi:hypothetical protein
MTAERNLHAVMNTISACNAFVIETNGDWPTSWADIDPLMPDDRDWNVHAVVTVDFSADPRVLACQDTDGFTGITVEHPVYIHNLEIDALLETLRRFYPASHGGG